jgi:hypothetical protein
MRTAKFISILTLVLSSIAFQGACDVDPSEGELDDWSRAADLCGPSVELDSTSIPLACEMPIPEPPEGDTFDPTKVSIKIEIDEVLIPIPFVESEAACNGRDGWYYSPNKQEPKSIVLCPSTCDSVQKAEKGKVEVLFGCLAIEHD